MPAVSSTTSSRACSWKARLSAAVAKMDAAAKQSAILVDGYKVSANAIEAKAASFASLGS
ncbi:hypothetical protein P368_15625 [Comamonas thiooxydans]|nr:hypothetical protein P365_17550 [Comamonas thiooxydans]KGH10715.1 hypothetical protein P368_15625 [Comamonas thiooxydans]